MLILSVKAGETVFIDMPDGRVEVKILGKRNRGHMGGEEAVIGVNAPDAIAVHRLEIYNAILAAGGVPSSRARKGTA